MDALVLDPGLIIVLVLALGVAAQWLAWQLRVPAIVLLLIAGLVTGPAGFDLLDPSRDFGAFLRPLIGLAVAIVLFDGGLNLQFHELRAAGSGVRRLIYLGAPLSWLFGTLAAHYVGALSWPVALVFGAIIVVTGPTVILPLLRQSMLNKRTASYLKWEGIVNDPIGALLAVLVFQYFLYTGEEAAFGQVVRDLGRAVFVGSALGALIGFAVGYTYRRAWVPEFLKVPVTLALVLIAYVGANHAQHEAGLLAVTVMGIVMGNLGIPGIHEMRRFKEYITVLLVSMVFVLLTADIQPELMARMDWQSVALIACVIFLVRPLVVFLATLGADMDRRDRLLLAWIAPRGIVAAAVAGVFAPVMSDAGYADAVQLVPLVFSLIFATVLLHGFSLGHVARWLGLASKERNRVLISGANRWSVELARTLKEMGLGVLLVDTSYHRLAHARMAGLEFHYGEILSSHAEEDIEFNDVGTLLALTSNDAYNALVCQKFAHQLGRAKVFQLPVAEQYADRRHKMTAAVRGLVAFDDSAVYEVLLDHLMVEGWKFQKTRLTEQYTFEDYERDCAEGTLQIGILRAEGSFAVYSPRFPLTGRTGDTVLCFGPKKTESIQTTLNRGSEAPEETA